MNRRIVFVMRLLGIGREGLNIFYNFMDICNGLTKDAYNKIAEHIYSVTKAEFESCAQRVINEENKENEKEDGVTTLIAYYSGKIIDLAIRRNVNSVENMKKAIMATYHMYSTNENSRHEDCPPGADSWWQKSQAIGESTNFNSAPLHPDVQKHILPIYEDLSQIYFKDVWVATRRMKVLTQLHSASLQSIYIVS
ncbi:hypothetical protein ALC53_08268 [Atta colombica]|uniref:Uncharacterized protein n=1 Tax=Atta colombica TaxID=520822 RepID=A0A195BAE5_9HYME|nr:hypothetical protein ALC53_08268 [Atta colombica]